MGRYLDALRARDYGISLGGALTKPTKAPSVGFVSEHRGGISEVQAQPTRASQLRHGAAEARDWEALDAVLDAAQAAYDAGEVTQEEAESLAGYVGDRSRQVPEDTGGGTLGEALRSQPVVRVRSRLLGETVVWLADGAVAPKDTAEVAYCEQELRRLEDQSPAMVRAAHAVKKALDGQLLPLQPNTGQQPGVTQTGDI